MANTDSARDAIDGLTRLIRAQQRNKLPVSVWIGAGASVPSGVPTLATIDRELRKDLEIAEGPDALSGMALIQRYKQEFRQQGINAFLARTFAGPHKPSRIHFAIARLLSARVLAPAFTTNYDTLLEAALTEVGSPHDVIVLENNLPLARIERPQVVKVHGSREDWNRTIFDQDGYDRFNERYPFLVKHLDVELRQRPMLFVGCSMRDPRLLDWMRSLSPEAREQLHPMRALMTRKAWENELDDDTRKLLEACGVLPVLVDRYDDIPRALEALVETFAPTASTEIVVEIDARDDKWRSRMLPASPWGEPVDNPLRDAAFRALLRSLRERFAKPEVDNPDPNLRFDAQRAGIRLASILGTPAIDAARRAIAAGPNQRPTLVVRISWSVYADAALALPWELVVVDNEFPVERSALAVVRDAFVKDAPPLPEPTGALSLVASIAAPENASPLRYEHEALRLLESLAGQRARFAELGTLEDLADTAEREAATALHFSGHGGPGALLFEDAYGDGEPITVAAVVDALTLRFRDGKRPFPRLFFLASCHGSSTSRDVAFESSSSTRDAVDALGEGPSTAAALHRAGFPAVIGFFGSIDDALCTRIEAAFYGAIAKGASLLHAAAIARAAAREPRAPGNRASWPFAWAQLAVYLRGTDQPLALANATSSGARVKVIEGLPGLPSLDHGFIGRRATQHDFRRKTKGKSQWFLLVYGLGGLGKTSLATRMLRDVYARDPKDLCVVRCQEVDRDARDPIVRLTTALVEHGVQLAVPGWTEQVTERNKSSSSSAELFENLAKALWTARPTLVLYIDNAETLQVGGADGDTGEIGAWIESAAAWGDRLQSLGERGRVLVTARYRWASVSRDKCIELGPMREADGLRLIEALPTLAELPAAEQQALARRLDGHPATATLLNDLAREWKDKHEVAEWRARDVEKMLSEITEDASKTIEARLVLDRLWRLLPQEVKTDARKLALLRTAVPGEVAEMVTPAWKVLRRVGLLTRVAGEVVREDGANEGVRSERWTMLTIVSEFVARQSEPIEETEAKRAWADAWKEWVVNGSELTLGDLLERARLLCDLGEARAAWSELKQIIALLVNRGAYNLAFDLTDGFVATGADRDTLADVRIHGAETLDRMGKFSDACCLAQSASEVAESDGVRALALQVLGGLQIELGDYAGANSSLEVAAKLAKTAFGEGHTRYAASLVALAALRRKENQLDNAEDLLRTALAIEEKTLGKEHQHYAASLGTLAGVLALKGEASKAEALFLESLRIAEGHFGSAHPSLVSTLDALAQLKLQSDPKNALELALRAEMISLATHNTNNHPEVARVQFTRAFIEHELGDPAAHQTMVDAVAVLSKTLGAHHPTVQDARNMLGHIREPSSTESYKVHFSRLRELLSADRVAESMDHVSRLAQQARDAKDAYGEFTFLSWLAQSAAAAIDLPTRDSALGRAEELAPSISPEAVARIAQLRATLTRPAQS